MHKDCCSPRAALPVRPPAFEHAAREGAFSKLLAFAFQPAFDADHSVAEVVFWGDRLRGSAPGAVERLLASDDANLKYNAWFLFDWQVDDTGTVAELFLEEPAAGLSPAERRALETLSRVHLRLYEVEWVDRGARVGLLDLWSGERVSVLVPGSRDPIVIWDVMGARVAPDGAGGHRVEGGVYRYPIDTKAQLLSHLRRAYRRHQRHSRDGDDASFFRKQGALLHHLWLDFVAFSELPEVRTSEGDPLMFCCAVFDTGHADAVRRALGAHPHVRPTADNRFVIHEPAADGIRELGRWCVEADRVVLETTSRARAIRGRRWLEAVAGGLIQYRAMSLETLDQAMEDLRGPANLPAQVPAPPRAAQAVRALFDRHYRGWLDRPEPDLGNRTPRAAARTKTWRPRLVELLKRRENDAARSALAGRPPYDFRWIWIELGLDRPDTREQAAHSP